MTRRFALLVGVVALTAILAFAIPATLALRSLQTHATQLELEQEAFVAAATLAPDEPLLVSSMRTVPSQERHTMALYGGDGRLIDGQGPTAAEPVVLDALRGDVAHAVYGEDYVVAVPLASVGGRPMALRVAEPTSDAEIALRQQLIALAVLALVVLTLSVSFGTALAIRLTRPVRRLHEVASELGRGTVLAPPQPSGIAEVDDVALALWRSSTQVHQVIDRERAFSAYVSHQLRTPLAAARVVAEAELAAPRDPPVTVLHEFLSSLDRLDDTTEQLLAVSRGVADRRRSVSLADLARRAHSRWVTPFRRAGRPLDVTLDTRLTATLAEAAFDQILDVVLDNALQHGTGRTRLTISSNGTCQVIAIGDQGHIVPGTEPFSTPARRGHGIGLTLAAALAEAEGWTLTVARRDPTTFELARDITGS